MEDSLKKLKKSKDELENKKDNNLKKNKPVSKKHKKIRRKRKRKNKRKKIILIIFTFVILLIILLVLGYFINENIKEKNRLEQIRKEEELVDNINNHYNEYVKTNTESLIYNSNEEVVGKIASNIELSLDSTTIDKNTKYFKIKDFEDTYIKYQDVDVIENLTSYNNRYKNYILFNQNIITNDKTSFYDENNNKIYEFNKSFDLPIIVKDDTKYGVEFNNRLLYVNKEDVSSVKDNINSNLEKASTTRVIVYHSFYDKNVESEAWCRNSICHPVEQIESHSKYISENNYFTLTMKELEMFIDGKINIPKKSIVITIDDGLLAERGLDVLIKYKLNATLFLITSYYTPSMFVESEYIEFHSHGHNIHNVGDCPGGQGGGIKCLEESILLEDLKKSSELTGGSTILCYPFYEYNNYSIEMLKKAGYTMAFAGFLNDGRVRVGTNKYAIPRYTITSDVSTLQFANIIK